MVLGIALHRTLIIVTVGINLVHYIVYHLAVLHKTNTVNIPLCF